MTRVLLVCLGNICRSPAAEGVLRVKAGARGLALEVSSAGTGGWHEGEPPDPRMLAAAMRRGYDLSAQRARQVAPADFAAFDYVLAMDRRNLADLTALAGPSRRAGLKLFLDFSPGPVRDTPDPFYGGAEDFELALDIIEAGADEFLDHLEGVRK